MYLFMPRWSGMPRTRIENVQTAKTSKSSRNCLEQDYKRHGLILNTGYTDQNPNSTSLSIASIIRRRTLWSAFAGNFYNSLSSEF